MKRKNATLKTNAGCMVEGLALGLRFLNEGVSIPGQDSRRDEMKVLLAAALAIFFAAQTGKAFAYACNNNYYVNSSGHFVHSPSCGEERQRRTAECRDGSVSFSEHHRGTCSSHGGVAHWD
jgi:predicted RNA-binding Zn-ribbon protein involved in translation (DUF1610 family)